MKRRVWLLAAAIVAAAVGFVVTRDGGESVVAGPLARAAARSAEADFRYVIAISHDTDEFDLNEVPVVMGEQADGRVYQLAEMRAFIDAQSDALVDPAADLTAEFIIDGDDVYLRGPYFRQIAVLLPAGHEVEGYFEYIGDLWGRVDVEVLGGEATPLIEATGAQLMDPAAFLALAQESSGVESLGEDTIDGVAVRGYRADVSNAESLRAVGTDPDAYAELVGEEAEAWLAGEVPMDVWVDDAGFVRLISFDFSPSPDDPLALQITYRDHDDDSIAVDVPDDPLDLNDAIRTLMEAVESAD